MHASHTSQTSWIVLYADGLLGATVLEQQLLVKLGLAAQLQYHRSAAGAVTITNPINVMETPYGFHAFERKIKLVTTEMSL